MTAATNDPATVPDHSNGDAPPDEPLDLDQIQGNIIGFNKPYQSFLFLRFDAKLRAEARRWLRTVTARVTTAQQVLDFRETFRPTRESGNAATAIWRNLAFTYGGLAALGTLPQGVDFPREYREGMRDRAAEAIGDEGKDAPGTWVFPKDAGPIHALLLLAADTQADLNSEAVLQINALTAAGIQLLFKQDGADRQEQPGHEHFGFRDGVSQPGIRDDRVTPPQTGKAEERILPGEFVIGYDREGTGGADRVDEVEPSLAWTRNGSYLVFRRLRQDVGGFHTFVRYHFATLGLGRDLLKAKLVGRYPSGAPLARYALPGGANVPPDDDPGFDRAHANDFGYHDDPRGDVVPQAAHIRKVNPRDQDSPGKDGVRKHRILRRGISYGRSYPAGPTRDEPLGGPAFPDDRGLLFVCYQSSIAEQFEVLQRSWARNPAFPPARHGGPPGLDPLIGQSQGTRAIAIPGTPRGPANPLPLRRWVTMTGGDYFFCPSLAALHSLVNHPGKERSPMIHQTTYPPTDYGADPTNTATGKAKGAGICTVLITVAIDDLPGIEGKEYMWRLEWAVLVDGKPIWESHGYDSLCVTTQGVVYGKAEVPVRSLLQALADDTPDLSVQDILDLTDPSKQNGQSASPLGELPALGYRRLKLKIYLNKDKDTSIERPIDMSIHNW